MDPKRFTPKKILWLDLEMTGLDPAEERILEVAVIVTDWQFNELESWESGVGHPLDLVQKRMDESEFYTLYPQNKQQLLELCAKSPPEKEVEARLAAFIERHFESGEPALLAGNSIHTDRGFIRQWWPTVEQKLHYRMLDVSAWKVVMAGKYHTEFTKQETHRAVDDIRESIAELKYYLEWFGAAHENA